MNLQIQDQIEDFPLFFLGFASHYKLILGANDRYLAMTVQWRIQSLL